MSLELREAVVSGLRDRLSLGDLVTRLPGDPVTRMWLMLRDVL